MQIKLFKIDKSFHTKIEFNSSINIMDRQFSRKLIVQN